MAHMVCALAYEQKGMFDAAISEFKKARNSSENPAVLGGLGHLYGVSGQVTEAQELLDELKSWSTNRYVSPYALALIHIGLGHYDRAFSFLTTAYRDRSGWLVYLDVEPRFDALRAQAQFKRFRQQLRSGDSFLPAQA